ncbi:subclass B1 metallo-beta-lactamase [Amphiplicatus metriothermophilus]|uniref:beta-lactamase n=1 Tax=Amphiplicatus metriothermophilus TaxID=1519374 RepID=A0A239PKB7_9PROT|nr:subclass B1 metallo-beta-lactamase [Amphiplicatus metriothermophilus]MBB5517589.1 glyoxylase-like metal-dependent hydrolase (beta-lactamase superfamily II) [Amphiplicatus metriothermophilus]SNT68077.1 metallo-beta-lactamase class B [Amphiplicatus metriothermophilus]
MRIAQALRRLALFSAFAAASATLAAAQEAPAPSLEPAGENVWIHKSYAVIEPWGPVLSQGLVVRTEAGVTLVDTAWNDADTEALLALIEDALGEKPSLAVLTHAHADKMGGSGALEKAVIASLAHALSNADAPVRGLAPARRGEPAAPGEALSAPEIPDDLVVFYPGPGHARDNIVVYHRPSKVLFGGCLIRPADASSLGNTADADIANWANAVRAVAARFPEAETVIPSHGSAGGRALFDHTIALAETAANEQ